MCTFNFQLSTFKIKIDDLDCFGKLPVLNYSIVKAEFFWHKSYCQLTAVKKGFIYPLVSEAISKVAKFAKKKNTHTPVRGHSLIT